MRHSRATPYDAIPSATPPLSGRTVRPDWLLSYGSLGPRPQRGSFEKPDTLWADGAEYCPLKVRLCPLLVWLSRLGAGLRAKGWRV